MRALPQVLPPADTNPDSDYFPAALVRYRSWVEVELHRRLGGLDLRGLSPGLEFQLASGGKRLRPALTLWWCEALGGSAAAALPFALAVELLHNAFLIHDDIEDGDRTRRGRPTLWAHCGLERAINVGDFLLAQACALVGEVPVTPASQQRLLRIFADTFRVTVEGQALEFELRASATFTLADYEGIIRKKTGRYLALGWVGGACIAGVDDGTADLLWEVGAELGPAFQIRDDLLDLTSGKGRDEIGCDIREGKPSILVALALDSPRVTPAEREELLRVLACPREETTSEQVGWVIELFGRCGAREAAAREARARVARGLALCERLSQLTTESRAELRGVAEFLSERKN